MNYLKKKWDFLSCIKDSYMDLMMDLMLNLLLLHVCSTFVSRVSQAFLKYKEMLFKSSFSNIILTWTQWFLSRNVIPTWTVALWGLPGIGSQPTWRQGRGWGTRSWPIWRQGHSNVIFHTENSVTSTMFLLLSSVIMNTISTSGSNPD